MSQGRDPTHPGSSSSGQRSEPEAQAAEATPVAPGYRQGDEPQLGSEPPGQKNAEKQEQKGPEARGSVPCSRLAAGGRVEPVVALCALPVACLLGLVTGILYFLAFPGMDLWPLSAVALVPLIVALRGQTPARVALVGWTAGFGMTITGFYWLVGMLREFSGFGTPVCLGMSVLLCAYQAGRFGLCGWLYARAEQRGWPRQAVFLLAFAASEVAYPLLFPWTYAATVHALPVMLQLAELGGEILVALVLVAINLIVAEPIVGRLTRPRFGPGPAAWRARLEATRAPWRRWRASARLAALPVGAVLYGVYRIPQVDHTAQHAPQGRVGVVQANLGLRQKRMDRREGMRRHLELTRRLAAQQDLDLVVWSETSVTGAMDEKLAPQLVEGGFARELGVPLLFGAVLRREVGDLRGHVYYNSALLTDRAGRICSRCRYDKHYLLAFGEYLPFGDRFPVLYRWSPHSGRFTPGESRRPLPLGPHEIAVFICYEDIMAGFVNSIVRAGRPDLLVNMTNDAWFGDTTEPWIHFALAKLRAVEHRRYLVRSTNSGISGVIDPVGRVVIQGGTFREEALSARISWLRASTPFELLGNAPWWGAALAVFGMGFFAPRKRLGSRS